MPEGAPDTTAYLFLALAVVFGFVGVLVVSMYLRYRNLLNDERTITQLLEDEKA